MDGTTSSNSTYDLTANFYGDGNLLATYSVSSTGLPQDFSVDVDGVGDLKIEVKTPKKSYIGNFTVGFAELKLETGGSGLSNKTNTNPDSGNKFIDTLTPYSVSGNKT